MTLTFCPCFFQPGPIPGMRPPMGAGALHQPQGKGQNSMGIIMPLYTIGIVVFFGYTIMKVGPKIGTITAYWNLSCLKGAASSKIYKIMVIESKYLLSKTLRDKMIRLLIYFQS